MDKSVGDGYSTSGKICTSQVEMGVVARGFDLLCQVYGHGDLATTKVDGMFPDMDRQVMVAAMVAKCGVPDKKPPCGPEGRGGIEARGRRAPHWEARATMVSPLGG